MKQDSFSISPSDHIYCDYQKELAILNMQGDTHTINIKELVTTFKKKSFYMLPSKHTALPNAHSRFQELIAAFLKVLQLLCI
jgi:hypothetical protein